MDRYVADRKGPGYDHESPRNGSPRNGSPRNKTGGGRRLKKPERSAIGPCTKYTLFFWNFFLFIIGLCMAALGAYILVIKDKVVHDVLDFLLDPACDLALAGSVVTLMGLVGLLGALREIVCCLKIYYFTLCLILLLELSLAVVMFVSKYVPEVKGQIFPENSFKHAIVNYRDDPDMQHLIDSLQTDLQCCGLDDSETGYLNWSDNVYFNCSDSNQSPEACSVPYSCCRTKSGENINYQCGAHTMKQQKDGTVIGNDENTYRIYTDGCIKALGTWIDTHALTVGGVMLGILLPQVFIVVMTRNLIEMILIQKSYW